MKGPDHLLFLHIPKSAGSTLHSLLGLNYPRKRIYLTRRMWQGNQQFFELSEAQRHNIRVLTGHMPFGLHQYLGPGSFEYFTILRNPVDRMVSLYYHIRRINSHFFHEELNAKNYTIPEVMESGILTAADNCQVRMLANRLDLPYGAVNETHLEEALDNLEKYFPVVGLQQHFDAFVLQLKDRYGWHYPWYRRHRVSRNRVRMADLDAASLASIRKYNAMDELLFQRMTVKIEAQLAALGPAFQKRLERYRKVNGVYERTLNSIPFFRKPMP